VVWLHERWAFGCSICNDTELPSPFPLPSFFQTKTVDAYSASLELPYKVGVRKGMVNGVTIGFTNFVCLEGLLHFPFVTHLQQLVGFVLHPSTHPRRSRASLCVWCSVGCGEVASSVW
jgi:hypothetical protein